MTGANALATRYGSLHWLLLGLDLQRRKATSIGRIELVRIERPRRKHFAARRVPRRIHPVHLLRNSGSRL
jgi:hypothetical protein